MKLMVQETKTKQTIIDMEKQCNNDLVSGKCAGVSCENCNLNKRFKEYVGIGLEEV